MRADANQSRRSGTLAGIAILALGALILWGTVMGRIPGARRFAVSERIYNASPDDGIVRVFLLSNSDRVVKLERLC